VSADNGWLIRKNDLGQFVVQMYFASADEYPQINCPKAFVFKSLEDAIRWYELYAGYSEYGLAVKIETVTYNKPVNEEAKEYG